MKKKTKEMLQRRAQVKKKNEDVGKRQIGMLQQQQDANNLFMQQDWMTSYPPGSRCEWKMQVAVEDMPAKLANLLCVNDLCLMSCIPHRPSYGSGR